MKNKLAKKAKADDPAEYKRFLEAAKEAEASDDPKAFEQAFKKVVHPPRRRPN
jgi:hypothetical protein